MSILIVGAGELGLAVLEALSQHPNRGTSKIAVLLRQDIINSHAAAKKEQISKIRDLGAEIETGDFVTEMVFTPDGAENQVVYISSDTISYRELADVLDAAFGLRLWREEWDMEFLRKKLWDEPGNLWVQYQNIFTKGFGVSWPKEETFNYRRGISLTDVKSYIKENKKGFAGALNL